MHIIDKDGNIIEGQELTEEQISLIEELGGNHGVIYSASSSYIPERDCRKIAIHLATNYHISRRSKADAECQTAKVEHEADRELVAI